MREIPQRVALRHDARFPAVAGVTALVAATPRSACISAFPLGGMFAGWIVFVARPEPRNHLPEEVASALARVMDDAVVSEEALLSLRA